MAMPLISVIMAAYNSEKYIAEAIESILNQTFKDFEFIIINDGSTDSTVRIIEQYAKDDSRIVLIPNKYKKGVAGAANTGLDIAKGKYIARFDSDDFSLPTRLELQYGFMEKHPEIGVSGSWVMLFGLHEGHIWEMPTDVDVVKTTMLFHSTIANPSVIIRTSVLRDYDLKYNDTAAEDLDLYVRLAEVTEMTNIPEVLIKYRTHTQNFGTVNSEKQAQSASDSRVYLIHKLGIDPTPQELLLHNLIGNWQLKPDNAFLAMSQAWMVRLYQGNQITHYYLGVALNELLIKKFIDIYKVTEGKASLSVAKEFLFIWTKRLSLRRKLRYSMQLGKKFLLKLRPKS